MHVELDIASLALARVRILLDSGLSGFGLIRSVFVCPLIPLLVLVSSFVSLAPIRRLLPSDTDPCHSLSTLRPLLRIKIPYIFASSLITGLPFRIRRRAVCRRQHWTSNLFFFFSPSHSFSA